MHRNTLDFNGKTPNLRPKIKTPKIKTPEFVSGYVLSNEG